MAGPVELLQHAVDHLAQDSDFDRRIAFVSVDNAVEVTLRTYLGLPRRARGDEGPSRRKLSDASNSFPDLLDLTEEHAGSRLDGVELADIEWYHRIRNTLYHQGNGITVDRRHVDAYLQIARILVSQLLGAEVSDVVPKAAASAVGRFLEEWSAVEQTLRVLIDLVVTDPSYHFRDVMVDLSEVGLITNNDEDELHRLFALRSSVVHSPSGTTDADLTHATHRVRHFVKKFKQASQDEEKRRRDPGAEGAA